MSLEKEFISFHYIKKNNNFDLYPIPSGFAMPPHICEKQYLNGSQLAKMKKSIPDMSLP